MLKNNRKGGITIQTLKEKAEKEKQETKKGKVLKSLTLPQLIVKELESFAKETGCKQADLVEVAICELKKLDENELTKLLIQYKVY